MWFVLISIVSFVHSYEILPDSLLNRKQSCQINCTQNQTMSDKFQRISQCSIGQYRICEAYLTMDYYSQLVSYSFTTTDALDNSSIDITAIRFRQLIMKFSKINPYRLNIHYYCRTQIDDCAYEEIETIYPVYIANQHILKRIQPIFYDPTISFGTKILCSNETSLCSGYCTLTVDLNRTIRDCNRTLSPDALGLNLSLEFAFVDNPTFTTPQVSSLVLICNKPNCNSNASITELLKIANEFFTAQSIGTRLNSLFWLSPIILFLFLI